MCLAQWLAHVKNSVSSGYHYNLIITQLFRKLAG